MDRPNNETTKRDSATEGITFAEFLENVPPSQWSIVTNLYKTANGIGTHHLELDLPQLQIHCASEKCNGLRFFRYVDGYKILSLNEDLRTYITYICSNCQDVLKIYSLWVIASGRNSGRCYKFGEYPQYGPPTPARLIRLFGKDREIFLKGRQCESHNLGIGAFTYYRRVVESHKNQILDEIIRVSKKIGAPPEKIKVLEDAQREIQFSKALDAVKDALPAALLVNGHNPLTLLHKALSVGVHQLSDEQCLQQAHAIRVMLVELADRLGQALKDEAEINAAIAQLLNPPAGNEQRD